MTRWLFARKPTIKNIMQRTESKSWPGKNAIVPRTTRFSNHVVKGGMKTIGKGSPAAREPIVNKTENTSEITKDNTVKTTGNGSTNVGDLIMLRIMNRSSRDFVTRNKQKYVRISCALGPGTKSLRN